MSTASSIGIQLTLKGAEQVKQGLKTISVSGAEMARQFEASRGAILTTAAAVATATGIMVDRVSTAAAEIERFAMLAGSTPQEFQRMAAGAKSAGMDMEKYASVMKDVQDKIGDFLQTGGGELKDFFEKIAPAVGVTADQFKNLSGPQALQLFYNSLQKANLSQKETVFWMESIADDATTLVPLLQNNGAAFDALADRAAKYGAVLSDYALAASKDFKGQTDEMTLALQGAEQILAVGLMPTLTEVARELLATSDSAGTAQLVADGLNGVLVGLAITANGVAGAFQAVGLTIAATAAQAGAFARGDFSGIVSIGQDWKGKLAELGGDIDAFQKRLLNAGETARDTFALGKVMKENKEGTQAYNNALQELIRMKDNGTLSSSQYTAAIKGATAANVSAAAAAGRTGKSLSGMGVGADAAKKAADSAKAAANSAKAAADKIASAYASTWGAAVQQMRDLEAEEQNLNAAEKALANVMAGEHWGKWNEAQRKAIELIYQRNAATIARQKQEEADAKWASESADANANVAESAYEAANAAEAQRDAQLQANAAIGLTALEVANLEAARIDDTAAEKQRLAAIMEGIDPAIAADYRRQAQALTELAEAKRDGAVKDAMAESAKEAADEWKRTADKIEDSLIDALMDGGKSGAEYIEDLFRTMVLRPVLQAIVSPVAGAVTSALGLPGAPAGGGGSGSGLNAINSGYKALTASGNASLAFTDFGTYATNAVYSAGGSLTNAGFTQMGSSVTSAANSLSKFSSEITTAANVLSYINAAKTFSEGKYGEAAGQAYGTYVGGPIGATIGGEIGKVVDKIFGWGGDDKPRHVYQTGGGDFEDKVSVAGVYGDIGMHDDGSKNIKAADFTETFQAIADLDATIAATLSPDQNAQIKAALDNYVSGKNESTADYVADRMKIMADVIGGGVNELVDQFGGTSDELVGYLLRLTQAQPTIDALAFLGKSLGDTEAATLSAALAMENLVGGQQNLLALTGSYYAEFYTEAERTAHATQALTEALASIGVDTVPATREAFRDLVDAQDLTTESGRETAAGLLGLHGAFAALVPATEAAANAVDGMVDAVETIEQAYQRLTNVTFTAEQAAEQRIGLEEQLLQLQGNTTELRRRELQAIDASNRGLQRLVWSFEDVQSASSAVLAAEQKVADAQADAAQQSADAAYETAKAVADAARAAADEMKSLAATLRDFVLGETLTPSELFADTLKKALGGDAEAMRALPQAATAQMDAARQSASTQADYAIARAQTLNAVSAAAALAETLGSVAIADPGPRPGATGGGNSLDQAIDDLNTAIEVLTMSIATALGGDLADKLGKIDTDLDGSVSESEFKAAFSGTASDNVLSKIFSALDSDGSSLISRLEAIKGRTNATALAIGALGQVGTALSAGQITSQQAAQHVVDLTQVAGTTTSGKPATMDAGTTVVTESGTADVWLSSGGAVAIDNTIYTKDNQGSFSIADAHAHVRQLVDEGNPRRVYDDATRYGISAASLDAMMSWTAGTSNKWAREAGLPEFSIGGYTGPGGKYETAGVVHRGEVVFSQDDIARLGGVRAVEAIRTGTAPGYADGGVVGSASGPVVVPAPLVPGRVTMAPRPATPDPVQQEREAQARDQAQQQTQDLIAQLRQVNSNLTELKRSVDKNGQANDQMNNKLYNTADTTLKLLRKFDALGMPVVQAATEAA